MGLLFLMAPATALLLIAYSLSRASLFRSRRLDKSGEYHSPYPTLPEALVRPLTTLFLLLSLLVPVVISMTVKTDILYLPAFISAGLLVATGVFVVEFRHLPGVLSGLYRSIRTPALEADSLEAVGHRFSTSVAIGPTSICFLAITVLFLLFDREIAGLWTSLPAATPIPPALVFFIGFATGLALWFALAGVSAAILDRAIKPDGEEPAPMHPIHPSSLLPWITRLWSESTEKLRGFKLGFIGSLLSASLVGIIYHHPFAADSAALLGGYTGVYLPFLLASVLWLSSLAATLTGRRRAPTSPFGKKIHDSGTLPLVFSASLAVPLILLLLPAEWSFNDPLTDDLTGATASGLAGAAVSGLVAGYVPRLFELLPAGARSLRGSFLGRYLPVAAAFVFALWAAGLYGVTLAALCATSILFSPSRRTMDALLSESLHRMVVHAGEPQERWQRSERFRHNSSVRNRATPATLDALTLFTHLALLSAVLTLAGLTISDLIGRTTAAAAVAGAVLCWLVIRFNRLLGSGVKSLTDRSVGRIINETETLAPALRIIRKNDGVDESEWSDADRKQVEETASLINYIEPARTAFLAAIATGLLPLILILVSVTVLYLHNPPVAVAFVFGTMALSGRPERKKGGYTSTSAGYLSIPAGIWLLYITVAL